MNTTWIIQTNMGSQSDIGQYVEGVKQSGAQVIEIEHKPFSPELPNVDFSGPIVLHGAVSFITEAQKSDKWASGIFGSLDLFTYENWSQYYNELLLNSPDATQLTTIAGFGLSSHEDDEDIFVRPQHDTKSFVGAVWRAGDFKAWCREAQSGDYVGVDKDTPIVVATPYGIEAEWRLFIVNNKVASASQYQKNRRLYKSPGAPPDVLEFAQKAIERWSPVPAYTLDICRSGGNCYIVEAQGFNSAGHYACDMKTVATAVNEVALQLWQKQKTKIKP